MCIHGLRTLSRVKSWQAHSLSVVLCVLSRLASNRTARGTDGSKSRITRLRADFCRLIRGIVEFAASSPKSQFKPIAAHKYHYSRHAAFLPYQFALSTVACWYDHGFYALCASCAACGLEPSPTMTKQDRPQRKVDGATQGYRHC
jgi:hypothetical protein